MSIKYQVQPISPMYYYLFKSLHNQVDEKFTISLFNQYKASCMALSDQKEQVKASNPNNNPLYNDNDHDDDDFNFYQQQNSSDNFYHQNDIDPYYINEYDLQQQDESRAINTPHQSNPTNKPINTFSLPLYYEMLKYFSTIARYDMVDLIIKILKKMI